MMRGIWIERGCEEVCYPCRGKVSGEAGSGGGALRAYHRLGLWQAFGLMIIEWCR